MDECYQAGEEALGHICRSGFAADEVTGTKLGQGWRCLRGVSLAIGMKM